jgi:hypothetical protein
LQPVGLYWATAIGPPPPTVAADQSGFLGSTVFSAPWTGCELGEVGPGCRTHLAAWELSDPLSRPATPRPEPDGDTIKFRPDTPALVEAPLRGPSRSQRRGISVRLEAIDALETHFQETHQELLCANAPRDELLRLLGFTNVIFFDDLPNKVASADQDALRGHVLSNGIDANGRLIAFVFSG